jgi:cytochrome c-type biogenesis protein
VDSASVGIVSALVAGLVSFLSPCVLPLTIPYLAWIGASGPATSRGRALVQAAAFVAGFVTTFVVFGITATALGRWLAESQRSIAVAAGTVLVVLGLHLARVVRIPWLDVDSRVRPLARPRGPVTAYIVGLAFAFGWSPCVGPILAVILTLAGAQESAVRGGTLLAAYGLGMGAPFLLGAVLTGPFTRFVERVGPYGRTVERISAFALIATGVLIMSGQFWRIGLWMIETFPAFARLG